MLISHHDIDHKPIETNCNGMDLKPWKHYLNVLNIFSTFVTYSNHHAYYHYVSKLQRSERSEPANDLDYSHVMNTQQFERYFIHRLLDLRASNRLLESTNKDPQISSLVEVSSISLHCMAIFALRSALKPLVLRIFQPR